MKTQVEAFYNEFSERFVRDYVNGNPRVERQFQFLADAIPSGVRTILILGCGSGQVGHFIATRIAKNAEVLGADISEENLRLARALFHHKRVNYRKVDVTTESIEGTWDVIVLPDVYEHIPLESRSVLHSKIGTLLSDNGKILLTFPSPGHQAFLRRQGEGLQIVDEDVTLNDLLRMANDIGGHLTYFRAISVWNTNDYVHAVIERGVEPIHPIEKQDRLPVKGWPYRSIVQRGWGFLFHKLGVYRWGRWRRRMRLRKFAGFSEISRPNR